MKKLLSSIVSLLLLASLATPVNAAPVLISSKEPVKIQVLHTNDVHGTLDVAPGAATWIKEKRAANPNTLVLDAGDAYYGKPLVDNTKGILTAKIYNELGYDAQALGNHEFDMGTDALNAITGIINHKILAANIRDAKTGKYIYDRYMIKEFDGVKVAIVGLTTVEAKFKADPKFMNAYTIDDPAKTMATLVPQLRAKGADLVIALAHIGIQDEGYGTSISLAKKVPGIDLIVDGHSHSQCPTIACETGANATVTSNDGYTGNFGELEISYVSKDDYKISFKKDFTLAQAKTYKQDEKIVNYINYETAKQAPLMNKVVGKTEVALDGVRANVRTKETNLGTLIADAFKEVSGAQISVMNGGGIRASIDAGDITHGEIMTVMPYNNVYLVVDIKGSVVKQMLEHSVKVYPEQNGGFLHVSGMSFSFDPSKPAGSRVVDVKVAGKALDVNATYSMVVNEFLRNGGDGFTMLAGTKVNKYLNGIDYQIFEDYLASKGTINPIVENRITVIK